MRLFNFSRFFKKSSDPEEVRQALFSAIGAGDSETFRRLCNEHRETILDNFRSWKKLPESLHKDRETVDAWVHSLIVIAESFKKAGQPLLLDVLVSKGADDFTAKWRDAIFRAEDADDAGRHEEGVQILLGLLGEMEGLIGSGVDQYRTKIYGHLGVCYFHMQNIPEATRYTMLALEECRRTGDQEGVEVYSRNLQQLAAKE
jgi:hypothetical protein